MTYDLRRSRLELRIRALEVGTGIDEMPLRQERQPSQADLCSGTVKSPHPIYPDKKRAAYQRLWSLVQAVVGFILPLGCEDHGGGRRQGNSMEVVAHCWQAF